MREFRLKYSSNSTSDPEFNLWHDTYTEIDFRELCMQVFAEVFYEYDQMYQSQMKEYNKNYGKRSGWYDNPIPRTPDTLKMTKDVYKILITRYGVSDKPSVYLNDLKSDKKFNDYLKVVKRKKKLNRILE